MRNYLFMMLFAVTFTFVGGGAFAHEVVMPGVASDEHELQLDEVLGRNVCVVDNFGIQYNLFIENGSISGTVDHPQCGRYSNLRGSYSGTSFRFHTGNPDVNNGCVGYSVTGTVNLNTRTASGTFQNDGGGGGSITFALCN